MVESELLSEDIKKNIRSAIKDVGMKEIIELFGIKEVIKFVGLDEFITTFGIENVEKELNKLKQPKKNSGKKTTSSSK